MRILISTLTGLTLIAVMFMAGGASLTPEQATPPASFGPVALDAPFLATVDPGAVRDVLRQPVSDVAPIPTPDNIDPVLGQALNQWFGCAPPEKDSICILRETGIEALVPDEPAALDDWRPLVAHFFAEKDVERAMDVIWCESRGDRWAKNPNSTASGLFQHLRSLWPPRAAAAGYGGVDVFDPVANVAVAAWLVYEGGGWSHWYPSEPCWG